MTIISARELTVAYGSGAAATRALDNAALDLGAEALAIMGPSGSGKTTLLHCLAGIIRPARGTVVLHPPGGGPAVTITGLRDAQRTRLRRSLIGVVFQSGDLLDELPAAENVALPLMLEGASRAEAMARAAAVLAQPGLRGLEGRRPGELSGGQAQRVALGRALAGAVLLAVRASRPLVAAVTRPGVGGRRAG